MTPADIVAEALRVAEETTPALLGEHFRVSIEDETGDCSDYLDNLGHGDVVQVLDDEGRYPFVRWDCMAAALAHVAERCARAEARLRKSLDEVMYAICENALRGEGESAGAVCKRAIEDAAKGVSRG